jgi:hypothetical protein
MTHSTCLFHKLARLLCDLSVGEESGRDSFLPFPKQACPFPKASTRVEEIMVPRRDLPRALAAFEVFPTRPAKNRGAYYTLVRRGGCSCGSTEAQGDFM